MLCLNPYCSGQWSRTQATIFLKTSGTIVLILIVVDNGLVRNRLPGENLEKHGLNPYCSGQWSRTRPYKTILIINNLKSYIKETFTFLNRKLTIS